MNKIRTANDNPIVLTTGGNYRGWIEKETGRRWNIYPNWHLDKKLPPIYALVTHSDWVWMCDACGHLWWAEPTFPRAFCPECLNASSSGFSRLIVWPEERARIERALIYRSDPKTRNWLWHETVNDLMAENIQHGV
jgi:hypothetical protein